MQNISEYNFEGKRALIRVDFNVPLNEKLEVTDATRIQAAVHTIKHIIDNGGSVVLMSHLGRPKNGPEAIFSLKNIVGEIEEAIGIAVKFVNNCIGDEAIAASSNLKAGEVLLLENLRFYKEETAGDEFFAGQLAEHGDVYVNDAFGTAHRAHASTAIIARFFPHDKMFGFLLKSEIESVEKVLNHSEKPVMAIIGGAKVSSKIGIIENLLDRVDSLIIGGGMAFTFVKAQGGFVGNSLVENDKLEMALEIIKKAKSKNVNLIIPTDALVTTEFSNETPVDQVPIDQIADGWMGLDVGEDTITTCSDAITASKTILWNGPMGVFEMSNFEAGTRAVAMALVDATANGAFSLIGGGDSVAAINKYDLADEVSYVSTGGGAMLEFLEGKELPGIAAIKS